MSETCKLEKRGWLVEQTLFSVYHSWIFIGRTDAEAETPIFWPPDAKNWLEKDPDAGKDWRLEEKGMTEAWDGWMLSPTWWTWVWTSFESCWWTGKPSMLQSMGSQRAEHDWATELTDDDKKYFKDRTVFIVSLFHIPALSHVNVFHFLVILMLFTI